jgi:GNAT superfamily N-acetyltransferase
VERPRRGGTVAAVARLELTVRRMQRRDRSAVVGALARAFYEDPLFAYFFPDHVHQSRGILSFMASGVADARPFGEIWLAVTPEGAVAAAAVWLPPGAYPRTRRRDLVTMTRAVPTMRYAGRRVFASLRLLRAVEHAHEDVPEPHFYLAILGTDPRFQRAGAGSAVLAPVLERCDTTGVVAYLETQKVENLAFYARHGFEMVRRLEVRGVPPVWTLRREPRGPAAA